MHERQGRRGSGHKAGRKHFEEAGRRCRLILDDAFEALAELQMKERRGDV